MTHTATRAVQAELSAAVQVRAAESIARLRWNAAQIREHQQAGLRRLLEHAVERSPFHHERLAGTDPRTFTLDRLVELPTMTKAEMMGAFDDVVTDRRVRRAEVDAHVAGAPVGLTLLHGEFVVMASGGSSGQRGVFVYDRPAIVEFALSLVRPSIERLMAFGVTPDNPITGAVVAAGSSIHGTAVVAALAGSDGAPVRITRVPATLPFPDIVTRLEQLQPVLLVGYPSVLVRLAAERTAGRLAINPLAVGSTSEPLDVDARATIERAFGVPMTDTFGSTEGLCGVSEPGSEAITFASDQCITELLEDRVLVTNLFNLTQPLIRYELTDRFVAVPGPHPDGHLRARVAGRDDAPFRYGDVEVHPLVIRAELVKCPELFEYQVHQTEHGIDIDAVATPAFEPAGTTTELAAALVAAGLRDPAVRIRRVPALDRDPATGKVRRFVAAH